jgi:L-alanine-DL-glutamate epimerase-like enolase superfamily enzyme
VEIEAVRLTELEIGRELKYCGSRPSVRPRFMLLELVAGDVVGEMMIWLGLEPEAAGPAVESAGRAVLGLDPRKREQVLAAIQSSSLFLDPRVTASFDIALWDLVGKLYETPVYMLLGGSRDRIPAYASGMWHPTVEEYVAEAEKAHAEGFPAYKLHPSGWIDFDTEASAAVMEAVGDRMTLLFDGVGVYRDRNVSLRLGLHLQRLGYSLFEAPLPDRDHIGYRYLASKLDIPLAAGEWINDPRDFAALVSTEAVQVVRTIGEWGLGITGMLKVGHLCEAHSLVFDPENFGSTLVQAAHLHVQLGCTAAGHFEAPYGPSVDYLDDAMLDRIEFADGCALAPERPGLGYRVDRKAVERLARRRWGVGG